VPVQVEQKSKGQRDGRFQAHAEAPERQEAARFKKDVNKGVAKDEAYARSFGDTECREAEISPLPSPASSGKRIDRQNTLVRLIEGCSDC
jgi:hypothetical protein